MMISACGAILCFSDSFNFQRKYRVNCDPLWPGNNKNLFVQVIFT